MQFDLPSFMKWLCQKLEPLSIADPSVLSQYIIALVGKEKPEHELKKNCMEQLDAFLQENTGEFVEDMFYALRSKNYIFSVAKDDNNQFKENKSENFRNYKSRSPIDNNSEVINYAGKRIHLDHKRHSNDEHREYDPEEHMEKDVELYRHESNSSRLHKSRGSSEHSNESYCERSTQRIERFTRSRVSSNDTKRQRSSRLERETRQKKTSPPRQQRMHTDNSNDVSDKRKRRCRNFDEQGFCFYGDRCKFEHGSNALVIPTPSAATALFNISNPGFIDTALVTGSCLLPRNSPSAVSYDQAKAAPNNPSSTSADLTCSKKGDTELKKDNNLPSYNPTPIIESLSSMNNSQQIVNSGGSATTGNILQPILSTKISNSSYLTSLQSHNRNRNILNQNNANRSHTTHLSEVSLNKNIIPVPLNNAENIYSHKLSNDQELFKNFSKTPHPELSTPPAYEPARPELSMITTTLGNNIFCETPAEYTPSPIFENTLMNKEYRQSAPSAVLVTKLPWKLNTLNNLHSHFTQFGTVINVETHFMGQNSHALVEFSLPDEATAAYRSSEPILGNRFIRLSLWSNGNASFAHRNWSENRYHNPPHINRNAGLGFSNYQKTSLLGDASTTSSRLSAKHRLGKVMIHKRTHTASVKLEHKSNRSRLRLERDEDGNPLFDEPEDEEDSLDISNDLQHCNSTDFEHDLQTLNSSGDGINDYPLRISSSNVHLSKRPYTRSKFQQAARDHEKAIALKQHHQKVEQLEKKRKAKLQNEIDLRLRITQLNDKLKAIISEHDSISTSATTQHQSNARKRDLKLQAKEIYSELVRLEKVSPSSLTKKPTTVAESGSENVFNSTSVRVEEKPVEKQFLPDSIASVRRSKIEEVKQDILNLETVLQQNNDQPDAQTETRKKIVQLKRKLVDLGTVRPSDLATMNANATGLPVRGQTKLDKRPRVLYVTGHSVYDVEDFRQSLSMNYLYTKSFRSLTVKDQPIIEVTFCTRDFAEAAMRLFHNFNGRQLSMSFTSPIDLKSENLVSERSNDSNPDIISEMSAPVVDATVGEEFRSPEPSMTTVNNGIHEL